MTSEFGTDLRAVRPRGTGRRECLPRRVALSEQSPYLGGAWVRLSLW